MARVQANRSPSGHVTIRDVAQAAGVSPSTVSHVLNNTRTVSAGVRKRVIEAAERLDFHPNPGARALRIGRAPLIEVMVENLSGSCGEVVEGIAGEIQSRGGRVVLTLGDANTGAAREESLPVDASIILGSQQEERNRHCPILSVRFEETLSGPSDYGEAREVIIPIPRAINRLAERLLRRDRYSFGLAWSGAPGMLRLPGARSAAESALQRWSRAHGLGAAALRSVLLPPRESASLLWLEVLLAPPAPSAVIADSVETADRVAAAMQRAGLRPGWEIALAALDGISELPAGTAADGQGRPGIHWQWKEYGRCLAQLALRKTRTGQSGASSRQSGAGAGQPGGRSVVFPFQEWNW